VIKYTMNLRDAPLKSGVLRWVSALHQMCESFQDVLHLRHLAEH
jgi:hypothetical protein